MDIFKATLQSRAKLYAALSTAAYEEGSVGSVSQPKFDKVVLDSGVEGTLKFTFKPTSTLYFTKEGSEHNHDAQMFAIAFESSLCFAFRGTEFSSDGKGILDALKDAKTDLMSKLVPCTDVDAGLGVLCKAEPSKWTGIAETAKGALIHEGFCGYFDTLKEDVRAQIKAQLAKATGVPHVVMCGHSLGGAAATVAAVWAKAQFGDAITVEVVTLGSPRVGNAAFAALFHKTVYASVRYVNGLDAIPTQPSQKDKYMHVGGDSHDGEKFASSSVSDGLHACVTLASEKGWLKCDNYYYDHKSGRYLAALELTKNHRNHTPKQGCKPAAEPSTPLSMRRELYVAMASAAYETGFAPSKGDDATRQPAFEAHVRGTGVEGLLAGGKAISMPFVHYSSTRDSLLDQDAQMYTVVVRHEGAGAEGSNPPGQTSLVFAFRGTEATDDRGIRRYLCDLMEIITDLRMWRVPVPGLADGLKAGSPELAAAHAADAADTMVHKGFHRYTHALQNELFKRINKQLANGETHVVMCGHSLGGAAATLAAALVKAHYGDQVFVEVVTIGSPRVGNTAFTRFFEKTVNASIRYVHASDGVPCLPSRYFVWALGGVGSYLGFNPAYTHVAGELSGKAPPQSVATSDSRHMAVHLLKYSDTWRLDQWEDHGVEGYLGALRMTYPNVKVGAASAVPAGAKTVTSPTSVAEAVGGAGAM